MQVVLILIIIIIILYSVDLSTDKELYPYLVLFVQQSNLWFDCDDMFWQQEDKSMKNKDNYEEIYREKETTDSDGNISHEAPLYVLFSTETSFHKIPPWSFFQGH